MMTTRPTRESAQRAPCHNWTIIQKRCLLVLMTRFEVKRDILARVFNDIFRDEINAADFPNGVPYSSLIAQFRESGRSKNVGWAQITRPSSPEDEDGRRERLFEIIEAKLPRKELQSVASRAHGKRSIRPTMKVIPRDSGHDHEYGPRETTEQVHTIAGARPARTRQPTPTELAAENNLSSLVSPTATSEDNVRPDLYIRRVGPPICNMSPEALAEIKKDYSPPSVQEAHPPLALLYRFWDTDHSQGINSEDYFLAKKYAHSNAIPARTYVPPVEHLDPTDVWAHLDKQKVPTPFISVSDSLVWSLNKILKKKEWKKPKLSIIDGQALPERAVFYALPFYKQFLVRRSMTDGHGRGISAHEYLVWRDIPQSAVVCTVDLADIQTASARSVDIAQMLRLQVLSSAGEYQTVIRARLQHTNPAFTAETVSSMAKLGLLFGLHHTSGFEQHRHLVFDLVSSYKMSISYHDIKQWRGLAADYAHTFTRESEKAVGFKDQAVVMLAFLEGVRLGSTHHFKFTKLRDESIQQKVQKMAVRIGLEDPSRIVASEGDAAKIHVGMEQSKQWKVIQPPRPLLLETTKDVVAQEIYEIDDDGIVL